MSFDEVVSQKTKFTFCVRCGDVAPPKTETHLRLVAGTWTAPSRAREMRFALVAIRGDAA